MSVGTTTIDWEKTFSAGVYSCSPQSANELLPEKWCIRVGYIARRSDKRKQYANSTGYESKSEAEKDLHRFRSIVENESHWKRHWIPPNLRCQDSSLL